ncbi:MAG TPA: class I SAM-dependent methyltransferase [Bryobacteraceae bacterium]
MDVHRPRMLVELGTHFGFSYFAFNQALKRLETKGRTCAVDTWKGDQHAGFYGEEIFNEVSEYNERHYGDFSELMRSTFDEAVAAFQDGSIDVLHIDGRHYYDDVKHDFEIWKPKLSERGIVLLHDTNVRIKDFGVHRLWEQLAAEYPHFEFLEGHGLGLIGLGNALPDQLRSLFAADENVTQQVRRAYARLGGALEDRVVAGGMASDTLARQEVARLAAAIPPLEAELARLQNVETEFRQSLGAREEAARLAAAMPLLEAELERLRNVEALSHEQAPVLTQTQIDCAAAREDAETIHEQFKASALLVRQQMVVIGRLQYDSTLQAKRSRAAKEQLDALKEQLGALKEQLGATKEEVARYTRAYNDLSSLIIPVWMRKSVPAAVRPPLRALKRAIRTLVHRGGSGGLRTP